MLNTIRVPKNLLYLTDRLPKPNYDQATRDKRDREEGLRRKTHEGSQMLPDINHSPSQDRNSKLPVEKKRSVIHEIKDQKPKKANPGASKNNRAHEVG